MGLGSGAVRAVVGSLMAGATCAGFRSTMGAPPFAGEDAKKPSAPGIFRGGRLVHAFRGTTRIGRKRPALLRKRRNNKTQSRDFPPLYRAYPPASTEPCGFSSGCSGVFFAPLSLPRFQRPRLSARPACGGTLPVIALRALYRRLSALSSPDTGKIRKRRARLTRANYR